MFARPLYGAARPIGKGAEMFRWQDYIEERKEMMMGKPVFMGTRLTVEHILRELAVMSEQELLGTLGPSTSGLRSSSRRTVIPR